ncbi:MAG: O-antigen ligase family protein [SAR324 cluster bacterium]|nr:O-antigen ligase family protein [SAR324 cluster bacterium]
MLSINAESSRLLFREITNSSFWNRFFLYGVFVFSTFSIAGTDAAIVGLYLVGVYKLWRNPRPVLWKHPLFLALMVWVLVQLVSTLLTPYTTRVGMMLWNNWRMFLPFALMFSLKEENHRSVMQVFMFFLTVISVYGIIQFFTGAEWFDFFGNSNPKPYKHPCFTTYGYTPFFHAKGNYSNHLTYGGVLLLSFPLFFSLVLRPGTLPDRQRLTISGSTALMLLAIVLSLARSVWIGTFFSILLLLYHFSKKLFFSLLIGVGSAVVILGSVYLNQGEKPSSSDSFSDVVWSRITSGFMLKYNEDRLLMWESGINAIKDHFWFGIGFDNDREVMDRYRTPLAERTGHRFFNKPSAGVHNIYIQTFLNTGFVGFMAYMAIWITWLGLLLVHYKKITDKYNQSLMWGVLSATIGFMLAGFFENNFRDSEVQTMVYLFMGLILRLIHFPASKANT